MIGFVACISLMTLALTHAGRPWMCYNEVIMTKQINEMYVENKKNLWEL